MTLLDFMIKRYTQYVDEHDDVNRRDLSLCDIYKCAILYHELPFTARGKCYHKKYDSYEVVSCRSFQRPFYKSQRIRDVIELTLRKDDDIVSLWYIPERDKLTYNLDEGRPLNDRTRS